MERELICSVFQLLNYGIIITDSGLTIRFVNRWIERQSGRSASSLIGKHIAETFPELKQQGRLLFYELALKGEHVFISEHTQHFVFLLPSGIDDPSSPTMFQSVHIAPLWNGDILEGTVTIIEDVTQRVVREKELQNQVEKLGEFNRVIKCREEEYKKILEHVGDIIFVADQNFVIRYVSPSVKKVLGKESDTFINTSILRCFPPEDIKKIIELSSSLKESQVTQKLSFETRLQDSKGNQHYFDLSLSYVDKSGESKPFLWIITLHEITESVKLAEQLKLEKKFIETVLETVGVLIVGLDASGKITLFNRACEELTGFQFQEVIGKSIWELFIPEEQKDGVRRVFDELRFDAIPNQYENHWITKSGERRLIYWKNNVLKDAMGTPILIIGTGIDVTAERATEKELIKSKEELSRQLETVQRKNRILGLLSELNEHLIVSSDEDDLKKVILKYFNEIFSPWTWVLYTLDKEKKVLSRWIFGGMDGSFEPLLWIESEKCWALRISKTYECRSEKNLSCGNRENNRHSICAPIVYQSDVSGIISVYLSPELTEGEWQFWKDILSMVSRLIGLSFWSFQIKAVMKAQSILDPLTGLYNRRYLEEFLRKEYPRVSREALPVSIFMVDIDHFKTVNDSFGHQAGDEVLKYLANIMKGFYRLSDVICRYGGEEFLIVCPDMDIEVAKKRAEKLRKTVEDYSFPSVSKITVSIGVASFPRHGDNFIEVIENADKALYNAKNSGRNCVMVANYS